MNEPTPVTGPYNFVPLSEHIILPEWGDLVSQDIPFEDGEDGEFGITVTAESPIYVRNGQTTRDKDNPDTSFFHAPDGRYCIPGTSIKGMVRSVLEIASFSRMRHISDRRYGIRDLNLKAYTNQLTNSDYSSKVKAGFLDISSDVWKIIPCKWASWQRKSIDRTFGNGKITADGKKKGMSAAEKYKDFLLRHGTLFYRANVADVGGKDDDGKTIIPHREATFSSDGEHAGVMVFTGQPQLYDPSDPKDKGKRREFFFYDPQENEPIPVDDAGSIYEDERGVTHFRNREDFEFIHTKQSASGDFAEWLDKKKGIAEIRKKFFGGRIPVFYLQTEAGLRFGLAAMFRFAGAVSTVEALRNTNADHYPERDVEFPPDMADLIFGYATSKKSLRGRVQFSACFADAAEPQCEKQLMLATPKPSFFPAYLEQEANLKDRERYKTFLDKDARLRGWKRYPALVEQESSGDPKQMTRLRPLPPGTVFSGKVRYHNLKKVELGALIWSLRLGSPEYHRHSLGMGKPYGFGKVKVEIVGLAEEEQRAICKAFTDYVETELKKSDPEAKFRNTPQIKSLLDMALYGPGVKADQDFRYMTRVECSNCKGRSGKDGQPGIPPSVLEPYRVIQPAAPPQPKKAPPPKATSANAAVIEQIRQCVRKSAQVLKLLKGIGKASPDDVAEIRSIVKKAPWAGSTYNPDAKNINAEIARLEQG